MVDVSVVNFVFKLFLIELNRKQCLLILLMLYSELINSFIELLAVFSQICIKFFWNSD
jgi:hypothetical protein